MANLWQASKTLAAADDDGIAESQSPGAGAITLDGTLVTDGVAVLDTPRRVLFTSGGDDSDITFTITGTNQSGNALVETITGPNATTAATTQDFATVSSVTHTGSVEGTLIIGTNGVGSTPWFVTNRENNCSLFGVGVVTTSGVNWTLEWTMDDPNDPFTGTFPTVFSLDSAVAGIMPVDMSAVTGNLYGALLSPVTAIRVTINSGTAELKAIIVQEGEGRV